MKVMISLPMSGIPDDVVRSRMEKIKEKFDKLHIEVVDSFDTSDCNPDIYIPGVYYLGRTLANYLCKVDAVYFDDGWLEARGCRIEHAICQEYGIKILDSRFFADKPSRIMNPPLSKSEEIDKEIKRLQNEVVNNE